MKILIAALILPLVSGFLDPETFFYELKSYGIAGSRAIRTSSYPSRPSYDFVIVGAGTAGSTLANRLSENPNWNVLLIEAGKTENIFNQVPAFANYFLTTDYNWGYKVEPQKFACLAMENHQCNWPRGKSVGGGSSINFMVHTRGNKLDYDGWAKLGNVGWSYKDVLPYFKKSERYNVSGVIDMSYHSTDGHVCVESARYRTKLASVFLKAGEQAGYPLPNDYNGADQMGFSYHQLNMDRGTRCSASKAYLRIRRSNLEIVTRTRVTKILIDRNNKAYGVEFLTNGVRRQVLATREVILSAGTIDSAKLLMLSGIGPRDHLQELGIPIVKDSKVGYNLYEHAGFIGPMFIVEKNGTSLIDNSINAKVIIDYLSNRKGLLSLGGTGEALAFVRTKHARDQRPDIELLLTSSAVGLDDALGQGITRKFYDAYFKPLENMNTFTILTWNQDPRSQGRIKLRSRNPLDLPILLGNFFTDPMDIEVNLEGLKVALALTKTEVYRAYGIRVHDIPMPGCEAHDFGTDDFWRCAIRQIPMMGDHLIGTAKMGPKSDPNAVVDPQLRVYGIDGLRVVDASIMPKITVGHTNAVVYMIGEKGADMIKAHWRS